MAELVLITGGAGFIGNRVWRQLRDKGYRVRILDNLCRTDTRVVDDVRAADGVELIEGDICDRPTVDAAFAGVGGVIHLAADCINLSVAEPAGSIRVNMVGAQNVFDAACQAKVRRVVHASSASVYGEPDKLPMHEDDALKPQTPYCITKLAGEQLLAFYQKRHGLSSNVVRYFNVYGPGQKTDAYYTSVIQVFLKRIVAGEPPIIDGSGEQSMDFIHVDDIAGATVAAYVSDKGGLTLNVGTGIDTSIATLARLLIQATGRDIEPQFRPRETLVTRRAADITRIQTELGWSPTVKVEDGIVALAKEFLREMEA